MPRRLQKTFPRARRFSIAVLGDSLTFNDVYWGVAPCFMWPEMLASRLRSLGAAVRGRNFGSSGDRTHHMINRADALFMYDTPSVAILWSGTNDIPSTATWSGTGGTITATAGQYVGVVIVITGTTGVGLVSQPIAVQTTATTTGSIAIAAITAKYNDSSIGIYTTATTYSTAAAAVQAAASAYQLGATVAVSSGTFNATTLTTLGSGASLSVVKNISAFDTQQLVQAFCKAMKFGCVGSGAGTGSGVAVASQTNLPALANGLGTPGLRYVVMRDTSTTGGAAATQPTQETTITGDYSLAPQQTVWEWRYNAAGEAGWGRVKTVTSTPDTVSRLIVVSMPYLNYSTGGDTTSTAYANYDDVTGLRFWQRAAVTAEETGAPGYVEYHDLYAFLRSRIVNGQDAAGGFSWHVADSNVHRNAYGEDLVAVSLTQVFQTTRAGWLSALK